MYVSNGICFFINTVNKESFTNQKVLRTYRKGLPPYKQNLFIYTKKDSFIYIQKNPRQILTANSCGKFPRQIPMANFQISNTEDGVEHPLCGRASRVKIKIKQVTKQKLWGLISLISKTNISNVFEISFSWKWLTPIVYVVLIIQLPSRKGARYVFNVPNCYLKTIAKYEQDKKYFSD